MYHRSLIGAQDINTRKQFLQHYFEIENKDGSKNDITSTLVEYGAPTGSGGYSAMAKLVGIPCAVGRSSRSERLDL
jgi:hypothetical protein